MSGHVGDWARFWQQAGAKATATLADLPPPMQQRLDSPWPRLASTLPPKAKVLDLATGGGIVLALMRQRRRDLRLIGVDSAPDLPRLSGMTLRGGVAIENLPFADASFTAITSRFGIEYAEHPRAAAEAARVLRPGGQLCLIVHHAGSSVVRHNQARHAALAWAIGDSGWLDVAANCVRARANFALPTPPILRGAASEAATLFPGQSAPAEFLAGLVQLLDAGLGRPGIRLPSLDELRQRAVEEMGRLEALFAAACDEQTLTDLVATLERGGIGAIKVTTIDERDGGPPLAWLVEGRRS